MKIGYTHIFKFSTTKITVVKSTDSGGGISYVPSLQQCGWGLLDCVLQYESV